MSSISGMGGQDPLGNASMSQGLNPGGGFQSMGGGAWSSFEKFLGPKGFEKFQQILMNMIRNQIKTEESKAKKAAQNLKLSEEGKPTSP